MTLSGSEDISEVNAVLTKQPAAEGPLALVGVSKSKEKFQPSVNTSAAWRPMCWTQSDGWGEQQVPLQSRAWYGRARKLPWAV